MHDPFTSTLSMEIYEIVEDNGGHKPKITLYLLLEHVEHFKVVVHASVLHILVLLQNLMIPVDLKN